MRRGKLGQAEEEVEDGQGKTRQRKRQRDAVEERERKETVEKERKERREKKGGGHRQFSWLTRGKEK